MSEEFDINLPNWANILLLIIVIFVTGLVLCKMLELEYKYIFFIAPLIATFLTLVNILPIDVLAIFILMFAFFIVITIKNKNEGGN